jgi:CRP-like cAMP-binding protein
MEAVMDAMDRFVTRENIDRYRRLASESTDAIERSKIMELLTEEDAKFKLELRHEAASDGSSPFSTATGNRGERDLAASRHLAGLPRAADPPANRLLGLLPRRDYERLRPHLHRVPLEYRQSLYRAHKPIGFVYFIETGVGSLVNTMANGEASEVGTIGNEGMVGLPLVLGDDRAPTSVYIQVPGIGLGMKASQFKKELARSASMRTVMVHYAHAFFNQVAQSAACNQFHSIERRCCRWMLMTHDRMQSDEFLLTQEFLAMMLGVLRTGVTIAAGALQRAGLIRYKRGNVTIVDRRGLISRSCECYGVSKREFDRLLGGRAKNRVRSKRQMSGIGRT